MRVSVAVVATILSILASQLAYAQAGILLGRVTDAETGARIPGATVTIRELSVGTSDRGEYILLSAPVGESEISVSASGYITHEAAVTVRSGRNAPVNVSLSFDSVNWQLRSTVDAFTDEESRTAGLRGRNRELLLILSCQNGSVRAAVGFSEESRLFGHGRMDIRFDEERAEQVEWSDEDSILVAPTDDQVNRFAQRLAEHQQLLVRATRWRNDLITEAFDLSMAENAMDYLQCE